MKRIKESDVEAYLVKRVEFHGGTAEKFSSPNRRSVPDRIVCWSRHYEWLTVPMCFVECKAPGKKATEAQKRDHARRGAMGFRVYVVDTLEAVDQFIKTEGYEW